MQSGFSIVGASIKTIMIVDEEVDFLKQVKTLLEKEDVEVVTARNSREALEHLKGDNEETFDLILVNTRMPGSTLTNALFSMRPSLKKLPGGIENFLQKPFTREELVEFVKEKINLH
jgi:response regulator RpfG family c-di-GMP phosphodiesterase